MKKILLFAAMLAMAASCSISEIDSIKGIEEGTEERKEKAPEITASYENNGTRTTITTDDKGVGTIWWKPADEINVFYGTTSTHYVSKNTENATTVAFGTTDVIGSTESASQNIWGLYPYDENAVCDGESVTTTIPAVQQAIAGSFDDDIFTSLAHSTSTDMTFYNVLGGIKFSLSRDDIKKITFKGNLNENIAGKANLKMDANGKPVAEITEGEKTITLTPKEGTTFAKNTNYYIVMLPTVLPDGFTMTFETDLGVGSFKYTEKSIEIKRSVFSIKENIDSYAKFIPFTISSIGSTSVAFMRKNYPNAINLEYRKDYGNWSKYTIGTSIDLEDGEFVQFRADESGNHTFINQPSSEEYHFFKSTGQGSISVSGNIMSLLYQNMEGEFRDPVCFAYLFSGCGNLTDASKLELPATKLRDNCYSEMFYNCRSLQTAPELPAINLEEGCYKGMFYNCSSLQTAPKLPATGLYNNCYSQMFYGCFNLQTAPDLPATALKDNCYSQMFYGCLGLQTAPDLPAIYLAEGCYNGMFFGCFNLQTAPKLLVTSLYNNCYSQMFYGCTSLETAPDLPATTLKDNCYSEMFCNCISLQTAPELPAIYLAEGCYSKMFFNCNSLKTAPELPATTLKDNCYFQMFSGCTSLQTAPELPAIDLATGCYNGMFYGCRSLQTAPALPAIYLAEECYSSMFSGCTSLQTAPELPATSLAESCYLNMFSGCSQLNYVKALFETTPSDSYTLYWLDGVSSTGTFVKSKNATWDVTGPNGIPEGWTVQKAE